MKYPRLPRQLDLRWKLTEEQIGQLQREFVLIKDSFASRAEVARALGLGLPLPLSKTAWLNQRADELGISYHAVYYWTHEEYREHKRRLNVRVWSKEKDLSKYIEHRKAEVKRRPKRWRRYPPQYEWHAYISAKNEPRHKRRTIFGFPIEIFPRLVPIRGYLRLLRKILGEDVKPKKGGEG